MSASLRERTRLVELVRTTIECVESERSAPDPSVRARIVDAIEGPLRYAPFAPRLAELWDIERAMAESLLVRATRSDAWQPGPLPGMSVQPVRPGPRIGGADRAQAMFLRGDARTHFPKHEHLGEEHVLVLEGAFVNDDGTLVKQGDYDVRAATSAHAFDVTDDGPCVCAYLLYGGLRIR